MKKKIGLLAFSNCTNYGALLQLLALQHCVERIGGDPYVIDLWVIPNNKYLQGVIHNSNCGIGTRLKGWLKWLRLKTFRAYEPRYRAFMAWRVQYLRMTKRIWRNAQEFAANPPDVDLLEVGSDQVFNQDVSSLFLCTGLTENLPRFSYGASFGNLDRAWAQQEHLRRGLVKFFALSAREKSGQEFLEKGLGLTAPWVVDPTLLPDRTFWEDFVADVELPTERPYIFMYWLGEIDSLKGRLERLYRDTGLEIHLYIGDFNKRIPASLPHVTIHWSATPSEFLGALRGAKYVWSNSFHAMMFSVVYGKCAAFSTSETAGRAASATRFSDVAKVMGCEKALYAAWPTEESLEFVSLADCFERISALRTDSEAFLRKALSGPAS